MKKAVLLIVIIGTVFLYGCFANADTVYQQLLDSSGDFSDTAGQIMGSFTVTSELPIQIDCLFLATCSGVPYGLVVFTDTSGTVSPSIDVYISTSTTINPGAIALWQFNSVGSSTTDQQFLAPYSMTVVNGATNYVVGQTYYIISAGGSYGNLRADRFSQNLYGFFASGNGVSFGIVPGIPGFTDVGVSTTSQQVFCSQNFSTSSNLFSQASADTAIAFCNVAVFLLVPSPTALNNVSGLMSTTSLGGRFPFSWVFGVKDALTGITASSTANLPTGTLPLNELNFASTTAFGSFLSDTNFFSTTTIMKYIPQALWDAMQALLEAMLWFTVVFDIYHTSRLRMHRV